MIYFDCFLTYIQTIPVNSDKKELRFGQNFNKLYSPIIQLDLTYVCSHRLFLLHPKVFTKWHDFRLKKKRKKIQLLKGAHPPQTPPVRASKAFLNVKARSTPLYANDKEDCIRT